MHEPGIAMKAKDDVLVFGEERIIVSFTEPVRMLTGRLQLHQIDHVDHADFQVRQMFTKNGDGGQNLERRRVSATGHYHIRLGALVVARPLPDADAFGAMHDCRFHREPLRQRVFARNHDVDIVPAAQAVVENRKQAIGIGRQDSRARCQPSC